jgi:hypothetical protein
VAVDGPNNSLGDLGSANLNVDAGVASKLKQALDAAKKPIEELKEALEGAKEAANDLNSALQATPQAAQGAASSFPGGSSKGMPSVYSRPGDSINSSQPPGGGGGPFSNWRDRFEGVPRSTMVAGGLAAGGLGLGQIVGMMDSRIDQNMAFGASIDRQNMYMMQTTGRSYDQIMAYRQPLINYRVDPSAIMGFEARTGMLATPQRAQSIEAIRHLTGYSLGTGDVLSAQYAMMQPQNVNMMAMMTGQTMYSVGGEERDIYDVVRSLSSQFGLTNDEQFTREARRPGTVTRSRMAMSGIPDEIQELMFDYGMSQTAFERAGGIGQYDPRLESHRKILGDTENTFAAQMEETDRARTEREMRMFDAQKENYATMERSQQRMIELLSDIDNTLREAYGLRARTRPQQRMVGAAARTLGAGLLGASLIPTPASPFLAVAGGALTLLGGIAGDPTSDSSSATDNITTPAVMRSSSAANDATISVPTGQGMRTLEQIKKWSTFSNMHPTMQDRVLRVLRENPKVGFGNGWRSQEEQTKLFKSRYVPSPDGTTTWNGQKWKRVRGAQVAPPGRSMHEIGLAADLTGPEGLASGGWLSRNASRFGLRTFDDPRNKEPWHVQPAELPASRKKYEEAGAPWGTNNNFVVEESQSLLDVAPEEEGSYDTALSEGDVAGLNRGSMAALFGGSGGSIAERIEQMREIGYASLGGAPTVSSGSGPGSASISEKVNSSSISDQVGTGRLDQAKSGMNPYPLNADGKTMPIESVVRLAHDAGFRGDMLAKMVAIAWRESRWTPGAHRTDNPKAAHLPDGATGDFGLWQINYRFYYKKGQGPGDKSWGADHKTALGMSKIHDYFNQVTNARAARLNVLGNGNPGNGPDAQIRHLWGYQKGSGWVGSKGDPLGGTGNKYQEAKSAMHAIGLAGDPTHFGSSYIVSDNVTNRVNRTRPRSSEFSARPLIAPSQPLFIEAKSTPVNGNGGVSNVINISPSITFNGAPETPDLQNIAKTVTDMMKREVDMMGLRTA